MLSNADLSDANVDTTQVCNLQFRNFGKRLRFHGHCYPLRVHEDHRPVGEVVSQPGEGQVLVVDAGASLRVGVLGDRLASIAAANGWVGVVIYGAIRDSVAINEIDIGVKALGVTALRSREAQPSLKGDAVSFGGIRFDRDMWVYCDEDSVLTGPSDLLKPNNPLPNESLSITEGA
ncbi:ribonuclease E activity regulator RraA [Paraburkholderia sp. BL25I1N1]|uniref:ribonuclease E activity regulator RraA n=1 Tax=Paraburkholderia sp. BL25I1N1 TaxID=1938804 RepID=UPI000D06C0E4|nr:ribonuclease E activity regulator RraA [Paraburkholderia sp. BL25I1N1]PRX92104.1 regulator of ribonuclease activity A [Paraburkholderia sp. BL25I1N1]